MQNDGVTPENAYAETPTGSNVGSSVKTAERYRNSNRKRNPLMAA